MAEPGINELWDYLLKQDDTEFSLPGLIHRSLGDTQLQCLLDQYFKCFGIPGMWAQDPNDADGMIMVPAPCPASSHEADAATSKGQNTQVNDRIPRPANAFILYRRDHHEQVQAENPTLNNCQLSSILGNRWQKESDDVKEEYQKKSRDVREAHKQTYPGYRYKPRRSSEVKRRLTKPKARAEKYAAIKAMNREISKAKPNFSDMEGTWSSCRQFKLPGEHSDALARHNLSHEEPYQLPLVQPAQSVEEARDQLDWGEVFYDLEEAYDDIHKIQGLGY